MAQQPAHTTSGAHLASRRTVARSAAWTAAAVTLVVATPDIAAASTGGGTGAPSALKIDRDGNVLALRSGLTADGSYLTGISALVTLSFQAVQGESPVVVGADVAPSWSVVNTTTRTATFSLATLGAGVTSELKCNLELDNADFISVTVTVTYTWNGSAGGVTVSRTFRK